MVSCGPPIDGMRLRVVDSSGHEVDAGLVGEIQISGASVMAGYLGRGWGHRPGRRPGTTPVIADSSAVENFSWWVGERRC